MTQCQAEVYGDGVDFMDPIMWTDDDGGLTGRVAEVLYYYDREDIPDWWYKRVRPYMVRSMIEDAKENDCGILVDARTDDLFLDRIEPFGRITFIWGAIQENERSLNALSQPAYIKPIRGRRRSLA